VKNALIFALLFVIALLATAERDRSGVQAMIEDTTVHHAAAPKPPAGMLFSPCPLAPRNFPRWQERNASISFENRP
jgi:hypothetical protein